MANARFIIGSTHIHLSRFMIVSTHIHLCQQWILDLLFILQQFCSSSIRLQRTRPSALGMSDRFVDIRMTRVTGMIRVTRLGKVWWELLHVQMGAASGRKYKEEGIGFELSI